MAAMMFGTTYHVGVCLLVRIVRVHLGDQLMVVSASRNVSWRLMFDYRAQHLGVTDGDTVVMLMDQGFNGRQEETLRLKNVFAPEHNQPGGPETKQFVIAWFAGHSESGLKWPFYVITEKNSNPEPTEIRTFTRYVATVYVMGSGMKICLNDTINAYLSQHPEWGHGIGTP